MYKRIFVGFYDKAPVWTKGGDKDLLKQIVRGEDFFLVYKINSKINKDIPEIDELFQEMGDCIKITDIEIDPKQKNKFSEYVHEDLSQYKDPNTVVYFFKYPQLTIRKDLLAGFEAYASVNNFNYKKAKVNKLLPIPAMGKNNSVTKVRSPHAHEEVEITLEDAEVENEQSISSVKKSEQKVSQGIINVDSMYENDTEENDGDIIGLVENDDSSDEIITDEESIEEIIVEPEKENIPKVSKKADKSHKKDMPIGEFDDDMPSVAAGSVERENKREFHSDSSQDSTHQGASKRTFADKVQENRQGSGSRFSSGGNNRQKPGGFGKGNRSGAGNQSAPQETFSRKQLEKLIFGGNGQEEDEQEEYTSMDNAKAELIYSTFARLTKDYRKLIKGVAELNMTDAEYQSMMLMLLKSSGLEDFHRSWSIEHPGVEIKIESKENYMWLREESEYYSTLAMHLYRDDKFDLV